MGRGPVQEPTFEFVLCEQGISEKDIGWVLSKLDSQQYLLTDCYYMAQILSKESETRAKEIFIDRFFSLNMKGVVRECKFSDLLQECIDKKKIWTLLEKNLGVICIRLPDASLNGETYLFVCGPNKKCPKVTNIDLFGCSFPNVRKDQRKQNPLEMSSLRLAG
tara:strand:- start:64 stop:552 length:489 start_codon:yes stop_codon:yes gene_type:complete